MSKIDYVTRESGSPMLFSAESEWDFLDTNEILQDYPYILDSIAKDEYYLENELCSFFDEILFEDKVVGFATFQIRNDDVLLLTECYILPEFRGNRLFFDEICKMHFVGPEFGILQPTRNVVDLLLDYAFAKNFNEDIVVSAIEFYFDDYDAKSTKNRELDEDEMEASNFYDLSINSTVFVDGDEVIYHGLLENDLRKCGGRKDLDNEYFEGLRKLFSENEEELDELVIELKQELPQVEFGFNEIVGRSEGLSQFMQSMVDEDLITYDEAIAIKEQLTKEYDSGQITDDGIDQRLLSLVATEQLPFGNLNEFKEFLTSEEIVDDDTGAIIEFLDLFKDNEELGNDVLKAALADDNESFQNLLMGAMVDDEKFMENFIDLAEEFDDEYEDDDSFIEVVPEDLFEGLGYKKTKYKLDDTWYGKEYPTSYDIDVYRCLKNIQKHNDLYPAIVFASSERPVMADILAELLVNEGYVDDSVDYDNWDEFANDELTISDLKKLLKKNNLKVSGRKQELINRVAENNVSLDEFKTRHVKITKKGHDYLERFRWIEFYEHFLLKFDFDDFYRFYENNDGEIDEIALKYLDEHIRIADETGDSQLLGIAVLMKEMIENFSQDFFKNQDSPE